MPLRVRRWLRRIAGALAVAAALMLVTAVMLVRSIDRPWLKRRLQAAARARSGAEVDWTATHVRVRSGLVVDGLVVRSPAPWQALAPELLRVEALDVGWTRHSLFGDG